ncbi:MAG: hypothetical protein KatS3mg103_1436 [Phycisphaerales bacterium]|nr:MAG: hypothetical protein KatS3mg103_1436 [Phycisphaerales bacterium]
MADRATPEVWYPSEPSRSLRSPKRAVSEMRVMASMAESICAWLAAISSSEKAPVLAASTTSALMELSSSLISVSEPSVVAMTAEARSEFLMPCSAPRMLERRRSEMISPAGSSLPRLMRSPVESRSSLTSQLSVGLVEGWTERSSWARWC